jgi:DNA polymerase III gamma/tau subunit
MEMLCNNIILNEQIIIDDAAKNELIKICLNIPKTLLNYMEKIKIINIPITYDIIQDICMNINYKYYNNYTIYLINGDLQQALTTIQIIYNDGYSVIDILYDYFNYIKTTDIISCNEKLISNYNKYEIVNYISKYISLFNILHEDEIELCFFTNNLITHLSNKKNITNI